MIAGSLASLWTRMINVIGRGSVKLVDEKDVVQLLRVVFNEYLETRDEIPSIGHYGLASSPPNDSDALAVFITGDRSSGVVIATNHKTSRPKNMAQGEVMLFDDQGTKIWLKRGGISIDAGNRNVEIVNAGTITLTASSEVHMVTPKLTVTGDIIDNSGSNTKTQKNLRDAYNAHKHTGVQTGGGTSGPTDTPS